MKTFVIDGVELPYYFRTRINSERTVEVALANWFVDKCPEFVEVGAVLPAYGVVGHMCYDLCEKRAGVLNVDAETVDYTGLNVLNISTIEHMGKAEYGNTVLDADKPIRVFCKTLSEAKNYLVTFPAGHDKQLDRFVDNRHKARVLCWSEGNLWCETDELLTSFGYGQRAPFADAIAVVSNLFNDLHTSQSYANVA